MVLSKGLVQTLVWHACHNHGGSWGSWGNLLHTWLWGHHLLLLHHGLLLHHWLLHAWLDLRVAHLLWLLLLLEERLSVDILLFALFTVHLNLSLCL